MKRIFLVPLILVAMTSLLLGQAVSSTRGSSYPIRETITYGGFRFLEDSQLSWNAAKQCYGNWYCGGTGDVFHPGWDVNHGSGYDDDGLSVYAIADGVVYKTEHADQTGYTPDKWLAVLIKHNIAGQIFYSGYGHMKRIDVKQGDLVIAGVTQVGLLGDVGAANNCHLHLEIRTSEHPSVYSKVTKQSLKSDEITLDLLGFWNCFSDFNKVLV